MQLNSSPSVRPRTPASRTGTRAFCCALGGLGAALAWACAPQPAVPPSTPPAPAEASEQPPTAAVLPSASSAGAAAETRPPSVAPPTKVAEVEGISEYRLDNGLRVLLFPDPTGDKLTVNITYFVGSRHEGYGEAGMAHLLEHMVFKGTPDHADIWNLLQERGAQFNGTTWYDRTNYYETLPASQENLRFALGMEADRMVNSNISADDLAKEFSVVRNEFERGENSPERVLLDRVLASAYLWHGYGRSTIGNRSDIERVPASSLKAFYKRFYRPDNAMLVVAGKFERDTALAEVQKAFGPIANPEQALPDTYTVEPVQDGEREVVLRRPGDAQYVIVGYHGVPGAHEDAPAFDAAVSILSDEPAGPLYKGLVETKLATSVSSFVFPTREPGVALFFAEVPKNVRLERVRDKMVSIIEGFGKQSASDQEVVRYVRRFQKNMDRLWANSQRTAVELTEYAALGDWRMLFINRDRTEALKPEAVAKVGQAYFQRANRTVGLFVPTQEIARAPHPKTPDVAAATQGYVGRKSRMAQGEAFDASLENIEAKTQRSTLGFGMKLALLPKQTRGGMVVGRLLLHFGDENSLEGLTSAADLLAQTLPRGAKGYSYQALRDKLDELQSSISINMAGPGRLSVALRSKRERLPALIDLLATVLRRPTLSQKELSIVQRESVNRLETQIQDPSTLAFTAMSRALSPYPANDVRYVPSVAEELERVRRVRRADVRRVHRMLGSAHTSAAFVGDFNADVLKQRLTESFSGWDTSTKYARVDEQFEANQGAEHTLVTPDKKSAMLVVGKSVKLRDDDPDYPALRMAGHILGGSASSRLLTRLREKDGLSYGAFGGLQVGALDDASVLFAGATLAPTNAAAGMGALLEEMERLFRDGVSADELKEAKKGYLESAATRRASDDHVVGLLSNSLRVGRSLKFDRDLESKISSLTPETLNAAIHKHLSTADLVRVSAGDLKSGS